MSSYQLKSVPSLKVDFCSIINISTDHIDYHGNFTSYLNSKLELLKAVNQKGAIIINKNEEFLQKKIHTFIKKNKFKQKCFILEILK